MDDDKSVIGARRIPVSGKRNTTGKFGRQPLVDTRNALDMQAVAGDLNAVADSLPSPLSND